MLCMENVSRPYSKQQVASRCSLKRVLIGLTNLLRVGKAFNLLLQFEDPCRTWGKMFEVTPSLPFQHHIPPWGLPSVFALPSDKSLKIPRMSCLPLPLRTRGFRRVAAGCTWHAKSTRAERWRRAPRLPPSGLLTAPSCAIAEWSCVC